MTAITGAGESIEMARRAVLCLRDRDVESKIACGLIDAGYELVDSELIVTGPLGSAVIVCDDEDASGLRALIDTTRREPAVRIVMVIGSTRGTADQYVGDLMAGVAGICRASAPAAAIVRTIDDVRTHGVAVPRDLVAALIEHLRRRRGFRIATPTGTVVLSDREWEVLQLMLQRRTTREIAQEMYVSVGTVRSHVWAVLRKLGAPDRETAIALVEAQRAADASSVAS